MNERMRKLQDIHALQFWLCQNEGTSIEVENDCEVVINLYLDHDLDTMVRSIFSLDYMENLDLPAWHRIVESLKKKHPEVWEKVDKNYEPFRVEAQGRLID